MQNRHVQLSNFSLCRSRKCPSLAFQNFRTSKGNYSPDFYDNLFPLKRESQATEWKKRQTTEDLYPGCIKNSRTVRKSRWPCSQRGYLNRCVTKEEIQMASTTWDGTQGNQGKAKVKPQCNPTIPPPEWLKLRSLTMTTVSKDKGLYQ